MKKLLALALLLTAAFALYAGGGKEKPKAPASAPVPAASGTQQMAPASVPTPASTPTPAPVATPVPPPPPVPQNPYAGKRLAILTPEGKNLSAAETYLTTLVQGVLVTDLSKYSAMTVLDRQNLERVLKETESGIYKNEEDYLKLGEIANVGYALTGALTKTASGFALQVQIADTANSGETVASYSGSCTAGELDNFTGIKKASLDLLTQLKFELNERDRAALLGAGSEQSQKAETALARGITAQKSGTEVQTLTYYYQAASIDPSLAEAVNRVSVMSANITSGNIGANVRNDIAWRDNWVKRLTETEDFFRDYIKTPPPYDLVYSTSIQTGAANYQNRTVELSFGIELIPASMEWFDTMAKVVKTVQAGLIATGRSDVWGFSWTELVKEMIWVPFPSDPRVFPIDYNRPFSWPSKMVSQGTNPFTSQDKTFTIVVELVNEDGISIGRQSIALAYGWTFDFAKRSASVSTGYGREQVGVRTTKVVISPKPLVNQTVSFSTIKADLITDKLTIKIVSVDGVVAETAGRDGHIMIATKAQYNLSSHGIAARQANQYAGLDEKFAFENGTIIDFIDSRGDAIIIPPTLHNGEAVTSIGKNAFRDKEKSSITIPANINIVDGGGFRDTIGSSFSRTYNNNNKRAGTYTKEGWNTPWSYTGR
ncbi:hypothetical protein FACS189479_02680 [Spirochaetia bacterium]|nr:hypothetical protein FACS189479_02680 [Spirochaetia bacterium]